tara:strand:+ start:576 stop:875 length:300 start_codon:yes stop_codon:yes gene_type:complete
MPDSPRGSHEGGRDGHERRKLTKRASTMESSRRRGTGKDMDKEKEQENGPFQEHFPCYEGLTWEALKNYLQGKWPRIKLEERRVCAMAARPEIRDTDVI